MPKLILSFLMLLFLSTTLFAQENIIRSNYLADLLEVYGLEYERAISDRQALSIDFWTVSKDASLGDLVVKQGTISGGAFSRVSNLRLLWREYNEIEMYPLPGKPSFFYALGASYSHISTRGFTQLPSDHGLIGIDFKLGLQWRFLEVFVVSTTAGVTYFPGNLTERSANGETLSRVGNLRGNFGLNLGLSF